MDGIEAGKITDQELVSQALRGLRGDEQEFIAATGVDIVALLLKKNADYGSSAFKTPAMAPHLTPSDAMLCRMSDKVARFSNLAGGKSAEIEESMANTMRDLAGYAILWLAFHELAGR